MINRTADEIRAYEKEREMEWAERGGWLPNSLMDDAGIVLFGIAVAMGVLNLILAWGLR